MVQKVPFTSTSGNTMTIGTGTSRVIMGADSGNLKIQDSQSNTSVIEAGLGVVGTSAVSVVANPAALPFSPISSAGSMAFAQSTGALYISNGSGWYKVSLVNTAPSISLSSTTANPTATNLTLDFTYTVTEPEGTPTTVSIANSGIATTGNVAVTHTTSNNHVRLVFDGTTKYEGDASVTLSVTDGVNTGSGTITISTAYYVGTNTAETVTLLKATGTGNNDNWDDKSSSNHTITDYGAIEQLAFSPYRENGYSMYFDGNGDYLTISDSPDFNFTTGNGDFTIESWIYKTNASESAWYTQRDSSTAELMIFLDHNISGYSAGSVSIEYDSAQYTFNAGIQQNKWQHIALVRTGTTVKWFTDGVEKDSRSEPASLANYGHTVYIGSWRSLSRYFQGYISDLRVVNGTAVYTGNFTPPTSRLTSITNTKLLIGGNNFQHYEPTATASQKSLYFGTNSNNYLLNYGDESALEFLNNSWTIEAWIYSTGTMSNAGIFSRGANGSFWHSLHMTSASTIKYVLSNGAGQEWNYTSGGGTIPTNTWVHVALVRRFGTDIKLYVNGTAIKTDTSSASTTLGNSTGDFKIGFERFEGSGGGFNGYISNFRFVNGTAVYTGDFTPPSSPLTNITNTVILHHGLTNEVSGGVGNPSNTSVTVNDLSPFISSHEVTPNGDTFMAAYSPYDRENAYTTATSGGSARLRPQGGNDYFTSSASADFAMGVGDFTLEVWVYPENISVGQSILDTAPTSGSSSTAGRALFYLNPNKMALYTPGTGTVTASGSETIKNFSWNHLAWVRNSDTLKMYMNGKETHSVSHTENMTLTNLTLGVDIAGSISSQARSYWSDLRLVKGTAVYTSEFTPPTAPLGTISGTVLHLPFTDFRIFDKSQSYLAPHSVSTDRLAINGNVVASSTQQHFSENTVYYDGSGDYIDMPNPILGTENHTHEAWVYPTGGDATYKGFFASAHPSSGAGISVSKDKAIGPQGGSSDLITFSPVVPDNEWSHIVLQRQSGVHSLYRNGVLQGTSATAINITNTNLRLASRYADNTNRMFAGYMHDFRVSKSLARYPYIAKPVTLTQTNSGMEKPDGTTPTATASNTKLLACHHSSKTTEGSATGHTITSVGSTASGTIIPKYGMNSVYFPNGDNDYLQVAASSEHQIYGGNYTVEAWLYPTSFNSENNVFLSKGTSSAREYHFSISASNFQVYWSTDGGSTGSTFFSVSVTNALNEWAHIAIAKSGNDITLYKNGNYIGNGTFTSIYGGNSPTVIGRLWDYTGINHQYRGYISNLRIVKGQALYTKNFTPSTSALQ